MTVTHRLTHREFGAGVYREDSNSEMKFQYRDVTSMGRSRFL